MRYRFIFSALLVLYSVRAVSGQQNQSEEARRYVTIPSESTLFVIASQPSAPVRFEDARLLMSIDGRKFVITYKLRNTGTKPIRYLTPVMWTSFGTGGTLSGPGPSSGKVTNEVVMPGEGVKDELSGEIVPLTDELRERLQFHGPLKGLVVLMVEHITFSDGTTYNDEVTSKALLAYFEDLTTKVEQLEDLRRRRNNSKLGFQHVTKFEITALPSNDN
jgi:hypothetical protein